MTKQKNAERGPSFIINRLTFSIPIRFVSCCENCPKQVESAVLPRTNKSLYLLPVMPKNKAPKNAGNHPL